MGDVLTDTPAHIHKISIDPSVTTVNVAVTQDAKDAHTADFTVNLKDPLSCKEAPASGTALGFQPAATELDGTYDTYTHSCRCGNHCRIRANRADPGIHPASQEGSPGASPGAKAFTRAPRAITATTPSPFRIGDHSPRKRMFLEL